MKTQLTELEVVAVQMALTTLVEDFEMINKEKIPWTPEAVKLRNEILANAKSALTKIAAVSGHRVELDEYKPGDEKDFLTDQNFKV